MRSRSWGEAQIHLPQLFEDLLWRRKKTDVIDEEVGRNFTAATHQFVGGRGEAESLLVEIESRKFLTDILGERRLKTTHLRVQKSKSLFEALKSVGHGFAGR